MKPEKQSFGDSRAWLRFRAERTGDARERIESALAARYNDRTTVGRVEIELAREPEGWRVLTAWLFGDFPGEPADVRPEAIDVLRRAGVELAHPGRRE